MPIMEGDEYLVCPRCGSIFVEYDHRQKRMRCLMRDCGWRTRNECALNDTSALVTQSDFEKYKALRGS